MTESKQVKPMQKKLYKHTDSKKALVVNLVYTTLMRLAQKYAFVENNQKL